LFLKGFYCFHLCHECHTLPFLKVWIRKGETVFRFPFPVCCRRFPTSSFISRCSFTLAEVKSSVFTGVPLIACGSY
jgi:hypothetical protein